jgi:hypothetical protein
MGISEIIATRRDATRRDAILATALRRGGDAS